ncbi:hypothetical protein Tco_0617119 [Tanacetum coccineum]
MGTERQPMLQAGALQSLRRLLLADGGCQGCSDTNARHTQQPTHHQTLAAARRLCLRIRRSIKEDDDESRYEQKRQWNTYTNYDDVYEINHEHNNSEELCGVHEQPVCNIRRYMMIKYSFKDDEEYVALKEDEYDDLTVTRKEACRAYQEIFQIMDEGWKVTRTK